MEETFEVRVKRLFASSVFPSASWTVADGEVERQQWNRERGGDAADREDIPCSSAFYDEGGCILKNPRRRRDLKKEFEGDLDELEDDHDAGGRGGGESEDQEIRSSVGLDPTLDNEDEEDEYDRVALCMEDAGERVYMRDVKDHGPYLNCRSAVPDLFEDSLEEVHRPHKDPRADHFAASARLKEDKQVTEKDPSIDLVKISEVDVNLKPILKRKEGQINSNPKKRVRFNSECKDLRDEPFEEPQEFHTVPLSMEATASAEEESPGVPDYIRNPSKYTCYTFDLSEDDSETSKRAFEDFRDLVKKSNPEELQPDFPMELPKTVTFIPRKKACDAMPIDDSLEFAQKVSCNESGQTLVCSTISEACEMEEDDVQPPMTEAGASGRKDRRYRSKSSPEESS